MMATENRQDIISAGDASGAGNFVEGRVYHHEVKKLCSVAKCIVRNESKSLFSCCCLLKLFFLSHKHLVGMWQHCLGTQL